MRVLVTGANGFVGSALAKRLVFSIPQATLSFPARGDPAKCSVTAAVRKKCSFFSDDINQVIISAIDTDTDWMTALRQIDVIVHTAARVHVMSDSSLDSLAEFRRINVAGTINLARQAASSDVKRFVFLSTIKVNGESTAPGNPFYANDPPNPLSLYGITKLEAEQGLMEIAARTGMEVVIIRPPLVYGPEVKANFKNMIQWLHWRIPLPLGAICNRRSMVALDNLVDLILICLGHSGAANQVFLAGDGEDISTTELLHRLGKALERPARLIPVPTQFLEVGAALLGKLDMAHRLCGSLQVDISKAREVLGWSPVITLDDGLKKTADWYLQHLEKNK